MMNSAKEIFDAHWPKGHYEYLAIMAGIRLAQEDAKAEIDKAKTLLLACLEAGHLRDEKYRDLYIETCKFLGRTAEL